MTEPCSRHRDRPAEWAVASHYIAEPLDWRQILRPEQILGTLCSECRSELIRWFSYPVVGGEI